MVRTLKEHRLVQEMIEDRVFYLYRTDFCAAATESLDGAVTVTESGGLAGGVFSKKPSVLLLAGIDPKETMPTCQKAACRMVIPNTSVHAWVIQSKSKKKGGSKSKTGGSEAAEPERRASLSPASAQRASTKGKGPATGAQTAQVEESHPAQRRVPQAVNSRLPMGLWAHVWAAHLSWLAAVDGYSSWCSICHEGEDVLLCDEEGCGAVQHAACSMQSDSRAQHWRCDNCWLLAGERPAGGPRGVRERSDSSDRRQTLAAETKRRCVSTAGRLGWVAGARVLDARGVEHIIEAMRHGYVQCSRPGCVGLRNYRRRELQLSMGASDDEESQSSESENDHGGDLSEGFSDQEIDSEEEGMAWEEPGRGCLDET